jgi:hypothetical protein
MNPEPFATAQSSNGTFVAQSDFNPREDFEPSQARDQELQLVRRLDWRFLLPNPNLNRVLYLGEPCTSLISALRRFSKRFCVDSSENPAWRFDLAVLRSRKFSDVEKAYKLLDCGGYLYWEIERKSDLLFLKFWEKNGERRSRAFSNFEKNRAALQRIGFTNIEVYWHRPNFETCLDIVPLLDQTALDYFFSPRRNEGAGKFKTAAGGFLLNTGLLKYAISSISMVAYKP